MMRRLIQGFILLSATGYLAWLWWADREYQTATNWVFAGLCFAGFMGVWWVGYLRAER